MRRGQVTLDLLVAVMVSLFLITWIQGFISIQTDQSQKMGITQENAQATIAAGSTMNAFYAMNPGGNDYAESIDPKITSFLKETEYSIVKNSRENELTITTQHGKDQVNYSYRVQGSTHYQGNCTDDTGGLPCVRG